MTKVFSLIKFTDVPTTQFMKGLAINENFDIKAKASNLNGDAVDLSQYTICLELFLKSATEVPRVINFVKLGIGSTIIKQNEVSFTGVHFIQAATGH